MNAVPSFYAPAPELSESDALFGDYLRFLSERNGSLDPATGFEKRDAQVADFGRDPAAFRGRVDPVVFQRNYDRFDGAGLSPQALALLAFVKLNAAEAYGVEVTSTARAALQARPEMLYQVERVVGKEETYHTQLLVGAVSHFEGVQVEGAWRAPWPLRILIRALAIFPPSLFHPVLLGAEISGVFIFNWVLTQVGTLFPDDPEVRESMEQRLIEVLIDEVGHIAFNRIAVGARGLQVAKPLAKLVVEGNDQNVPELPALGLSAEVKKGIDRFDYMSLPEEVRRRSWFV
ncbi:MAG: hypothetical protein H6741_13460 [Alphaproteobacteria bacterium]|nr:hypothetical protein [Alphaproteobacteria bacterium]